MRCLFLVCALAVSPALASCGYAPPARTDTDSPQYQSDLDACQTSVPDTVDKHNAKTGLSWMSGPFTRWSRIGDGLDACMGTKGWGHVRACTAEERRQGAANGTLVVTRSGITCSDPNAPARSG